MESLNDRSVLLELFRATNGPSWYRNDGWGISENISTWYGVEVDGDGRVVKLDLVQNKLKGPIPESLGQLSMLTYLALFKNQLSGPIPESLGQLSNLTELDLSDNKLSGPIPEFLGRLSNLTHLRLSSNEMSGPIPESLGRLSNLTHLRLSSNEMSGPIPESLGQLSNLTELDLSSNQLSGPIPEFLGQLSNMTELWLSDNQLSGPIPESLGRLSNMTYLALSNNQLSGPIPESLGQLSNLTELDLSDNKLSGPIPEFLGQLSNMTELWLSNNQLSGTIPESLGRLTNVKMLDLSNNQLTGISKEAARRLQHLNIRLPLLNYNPWNSPPADVVDGGFKAIVGYWEAVARSGAIESWRLKVVLVGAVKAGKTSLVKGMIDGQPHLCRDDDRTKGVDVHVDRPFKPDAERKLELIFWDFAGHSEYSSSHQLFLSKGALNLLVVDLKRFYDEPLARGELVDVWLDALECRVPGSNILVVATQTDRLNGDLEAKLGDLRERVESHLRVQRERREQARRRGEESHGNLRGLIFHGVKAVSSKKAESLMELPRTLSTLVYTKPDMFPSVGQWCPVSWARVSAMLNAKQLGKDFYQQVSRVGAVEQNQGKLRNITAGVKFVQRKEAKYDWSRVVETLKLENEVGRTKEKCENVFENAVGQLVREGMLLDSDGILYLEPVWINNLLRSVLDHDLADVGKDRFWKEELTKFSDGSNKIFFDLKDVHDNFPSTGILTVRYLRFLWRHVPEVSDEIIFSSLIGTLSRHGIVFGGNPSGADMEHTLNADNNAELFVPLHLPSKVLESELGIETLLKHQSQKETVYEICQTYVPPGLLGVLMGRFLCCGGVKFRKCWSRGAVFTLGEVLVLLLLNIPSHGEDEASIKVTLFGERFVSGLTLAMDKIEEEVKRMFVERFPGVFFNRKAGYPRDVECKNAVVARIDGIEEHLDIALSALLQGLHQVEENLQDVAKNCRTTLARLNKLQSGEVPCPNLVIIRPATSATLLGGKKRSLWAMMKGLGRRAKKVARKDLRLCFICPYDFSEVPCGLNANGYPFPATRDWVKKIRPALKVTAVLVNVAIKAASSGLMDLPVSDFLDGTKSYLVEELADRLPDEDAIERALDGSTVPAEEGKAKKLVGEAYEELNKFMKEHESNVKGSYIHFNTLMQLVDDGDGGKVWVSNENAQRWKDALL